MGYPNFGKVRTITLPYETDMTAAQYFARYGIDLATIEMYDLVNIALSDVVYPVLAIDKENKILYMADKAYSYAAGLNEIDSSLIAEVISEGSIVNAKPIYYHPIRIITENSDGEVLVFQATVLNNDETPFTSTTFIAYIKNLMQTYGAIININGSIQLGASSYGSPYLIYYYSNSYKIEYHTDTTVASADLDSFLDNVTGFSDGVNKIN